MKNKSIIRLLLLAVTSIFLYSCMNEDLYSSSEKEKQEIQSKSLWKEDMIFITNVKEIFLKNASLENFKTNHGGLPQWEYAMTFGDFDESYLMVPVFGENTVTGVVTVKRIEDMVYFKFSKDEKAKSFFSHLISSENKKLTPVKDIAENAKIVCTSRTYLFCFPNNDGTQDCYPQMVVKCISEDSFEDNDMGGDNSGDDGLPYGGGSGGNTNPQQNQNPCAKLKTQNANPNFKAKIEALNKNSVFTAKNETGFTEKKDGTFTTLPVSPNAGPDHNALSVTYDADTKGYIHSHQNDYETGDYDPNGSPIMKQPIRMLSPADVNTLMLMAQLQTDGNYSELYGTMVSSSGIYTIKFTGTASGIQTGFGTEQWRTDYLDYRKLHDDWTVERLFLTFLKDKMNVQGVELYKIKSNGTVQKKTLNSNNKVQSNDCPQ
ncbi:hypothetical protein [Chryseobacterium limigenitum]|uniref:Lipoprotein n=1 Tax=Chryseobacterium limigenitum TaxID=1612149 RepID=A0A1K2IVG7_9FLAO|nr:hypothetical protein [Chryseobacterium limigenitum]SFZ96258.1 hypothetical protein SAMN05216324_11773 [Chryseobacterium limigenitum]